MKHGDSRVSLVHGLSSCVEGVPCLTRGAGGIQIKVEKGGQMRTGGNVRVDVSRGVVYVDKAAYPGF